MLAGFQQESSGILIYIGFKSIDMQIILTPQESEEIFFNSLCNGLSYMSGYGLTFEYNDADYQAARDRLLAANPTERPSYEDVFMEILRSGGTMQVVDHESDGEYNATISLKDIHERVALAPPSRLLEFINEEDDADTADVVLQTVFYKEVIFG
jgi:hypothetical protein